MPSSPDHKIVRALERALPLWIWFAAVIVPIAVALLLVPSRGHLGPADDALVLVVVTVAIASWGNRGAAALAALASAASFDFLLTRPYGSFRISRPGDITTEVLFVAVGLLVGELAARGRQHQRAAVRGHMEISRLHDLGQRIAGRGTRVRPHRSGQRASGASQPAGLPLRPRAAVRKGGMDRSRRHSSTQPASLAHRHSRSSDETGGAPRSWGREDSGDLPLDPDAGGAHQP